MRYCCALAHQAVVPLFDTPASHHLVPSDEGWEPQLGTRTPYPAVLSYPRLASMRRTYIHRRIPVVFKTGLAVDYKVVDYVFSTPPEENNLIYVNKMAVIYILLYIVCIDVYIHEVDYSV